MAGARACFMILTVLLLASSAAFVALARRRPPAPDLADIRAVARTKAFDRAQSLLDRYLRVYPRSVRAHLLMAQLATEPTNSQPTVALEHLRAVIPASAMDSALIKFLEGKARYHEGRYDLAEDCWTESLRLDPAVPEAGWVLMDLLDKEGRTEEAHRVGMELYAVEPDAVDRVRILLELARLDIEAPDPLSQIELFEPIIRHNTTCLALGLSVSVALIRVNRIEEGLGWLRRALERHPDAPEVWDVWLSGLYLASEPDKLASEFARLPKHMSADPRFAEHAGIVAQLAQKWPESIRAYRRALAFEPYNWSVLYRYRFALKQADQTVEFNRIDQICATYRSSYQRMRGSAMEPFRPYEPSAPGSPVLPAQPGAYYETIALKSLGRVPDAKLYQRLAALREGMGRFDEAVAWYLLVLRDSPSDAVSLGALERLN
jgi:tetratricopeptide (TPR) repeat protein